MSWRDRYRVASFRGVEFNVDEAEGSYGRRQSINEYPQIEIPYVEDMGRAHDEFTLQGYVIGADYDIQRDALIAACRDQGSSGRLVHPYLGEMTVRCLGLRVRESSDRGGSCLLQFVFIEQGELQYPKATLDSVSAISGRGAGLIKSVKSAFSSLYKVTGYIGYVREQATAEVSQFSKFMGELADPISSGLNDAAEFAFEIKKLASDASSLVNTPGKLADRIGTILSLVSTTFIDSGAVYNRIATEYAPFESVNYATVTPSRKQQKTNSQQFFALVREQSIAERATVAAAVDYPSYQDAIVVRDEIADQLDIEAESVADDDVYLAVGALRAEVTRGIPQDGQKLPQLRDVSFQTSLPALVVAYAVYEDATRETEIVARNHIRHPGFMPGGRNIEVVADV